MTDPLIYHLARVTVPAQWTTYQIHQHLWKGYDREPGSVQPFTFRRLVTSPSKGKVHVLLQSVAAPSPTSLGLTPEEMRQVGLPPVGHQVAFGVRLQAIVQSSGKAAGVKPHQRPIRDPAERDRWITDRLTRAGLIVDSFWSRQDAVVESWKTHTLNTEATWVEGLAVVRDPLALYEVIQKGVGRGRSFGFGLLSLARP